MLRKHVVAVSRSKTFDNFLLMIPCTRLDSITEVQSVLDDTKFGRDIA